MSYDQSIGILIAVCIFSLFYIAFNLKENHKLLRILFFVFGIGFMGVGVKFITYLSNNITDLTFRESFLGMLHLVYLSIWWILLPYMVLWFLYEFFRIIFAIIQHKKETGKWELI